MTGTDIGHLLEVARRASLVSRCELARRCHTSDARVVKRIEEGDVAPRLETVERMAGALGYRIEYTLIPLEQK